MRTLIRVLTVMFVFGLSQGASASLMQRFDVFDPERSLLEGTISKTLSGGPQSPDGWVTRDLFCEYLPNGKVKIVKGVNKAYGAAIGFPIWGPVRSEVDTKLDEVGIAELKKMIAEIYVDQEKSVKELEGQKADFAASLYAFHKNGPQTSAVITLMSQYEGYTPRVNMHPSAQKLIEFIKTTCVWDK